MAGETCSNCHTTESWNGASWCPKCGYYPKLGRQAFQPVEEDGEEAAPETLGEFLAYVPSWIWLVSGAIFGLFVASVAIRLSFPDIAIRGGIAQLQFFFGVLLFLIAHIRAYFIATHESDKVGPGSFFFQPGEIWRSVFKQLPESNGLVASSASGLMAILLAFTVIGFDYDAIFKPNEEVAQKEKFNPLKYVMQGAQMVAMVQQGGGDGCYWWRR